MTNAQLEVFVDSLRRWEGAAPWMYLDSADPPRVTVGIGVMLPDLAHALALPFVNVSTGQPAMREEVTAAFEAVTHAPHGRSAAFYRSPSHPIELLPDDVVQACCDRLLHVFLPDIEAHVPGFDSLPQAAQLALVDIAWNTGSLVRWPGLCEAVASRDWAVAAAQSHRAEKLDTQGNHIGGCRKARNDWTHDAFLSCVGG